MRGCDPLAAGLHQLITIVIWFVPLVIGRASFFITLLDCRPAVLLKRIRRGDMAKYEVPGMKLIPQRLNMSCWYASAKMIINWQMGRCRQSFNDLVPPELDAQCRALRGADAGITNPVIVQMAVRLGLKQVPPMSETSSDIESLLRGRGPLWVNGDRHIVVIAGVDGDRVKVYDPWPPDQGKIEWRLLSGWLFRETAGTYKVQRGDSLSAIGRRHGVDWGRIYNHPSNAAFRAKRPNPNQIQPGDEIFIPTSASDMDTSGAVSFLYLPGLPRLS